MRILREVEVLLHALSLYGAIGVAAFGWGVCCLLEWEAKQWLPLWFCAVLVIYNADRLRPEPADVVNIPLRTASSRRLRGISFGICAVAAVFLFAFPLFTRDWLTFSLVIGGAVTCLNYSIPLFGFRWKDVPLLKTFFVPTIVTAAIFGLPWLHLDPGTDGGTFLLTVLRCWSFLFFNVILCDLRDIDGDRSCGIRSVPVALGVQKTRWLLAALIILIEALALGALAHEPVRHQTTLQIICIVCPLYLGSLLLAVRRPQPERFYEWAVEGMLFLPAFAMILGE